MFDLAALANATQPHTAIVGSDEVESASEVVVGQAVNFDVGRKIPISIKPAK